MRKVAVLVAGTLLAGLLTATPQAAAAPDHTAGRYQPIAATRVLDTRTGLGGYRGLVSPRRTVTFPVSASAAGTWQAAVLVVTVPTPAPAGSLSVYPSGTTWDGRVTMTLTGGGNIQQQLTVGLGADGRVTIRSNAARPTNLLVDVLGYYAAGTAAVTGMFTVASGRVLDTRKGTGTAVRAGRKVTLALAGRVGIPAGGAVAVVANVAVLAPRSTGQLVITDGDGSQATPRLRFVGSRAAPRTMQTQRTLRLGGDANLSFTNSSAGSVHLVVDVFGYFLRGGLEPDFFDFGYYVPLSPQPATALVLHGRPPVEIRLAPADGSWEAANLVITTDRPSQPVALGVWATAAWSGSPVVSSSAWLQPTELTVGMAGDSVMVRGLSGTADVALHLSVTGYYGVSPGV